MYSEKTSIMNLFIKKLRVYGQYIFLSFLLINCAGPGSQTAPKSTAEVCSVAPLENFVFAAKSSAEKSQRAVGNAEKAKFAKEGIKWSDDCLVRFKKTPACLYYRALNTGLYYKVSKLGYQKGLKQMQLDLQEVIKLEESFSYGGAYRILGNIYFKAPSFSLAKNAVTKDIDLADHYADQAMRISSIHLENQLLRALVDLELGNEERAKSLLKNVKLQFEKKDFNSLTTDQKKDYQRVKKELSKL